MTRAFDRPERRATARGEATRERILRSAAELIHRRGVAATSVNDVLAASGTGKSQFYHYFACKADLVRALIDFRMDEAMREEAPLLAKLDTWEGIAEWLGRIEAEHVRGGLVGGCPIGSLAAELADQDEVIRCDLAAALRTKREHLREGLAAMKERGELRQGADPDALADFMGAAIQGGLLLSTAERSVTPLRSALQGALAHLRSFAGG